MITRPLLVRIALLSGLTVAACGEKKPVEATASGGAEQPPADAQPPDAIPEVEEADEVADDGAEPDLPEGALVCLTHEETAAAMGVANDDAFDCPVQLTRDQALPHLQPWQDPHNLSLPSEIRKMPAYSDAVRCCFEQVMVAQPTPDLDDLAPMKGRPMIVDGELRLPQLEGPAGKGAAAAWREDARHELSSVSAFERAAAELAACGGPPELVARCLVAAADEARHAVNCLTVASALDGRGTALGPAPAWTPRDLDVVGIAVTTLVEGALPETLAAAEARLAAHRCTDPEIRTVLQTIAVDEQQHADLAWAIIGWARQVGGAAVDKALSASLSAVSMPGSQGASRDDGTGRLGDTDRAELAAVLLRDVFTPLARAAA